MPLIAVDFDGTIAEYEEFKGWNSVGKPIAGAIDFLKVLKEIGFDIAIYSARAKDEKGKEAIEKWVKDNGIEDLIEFVTHEKLPEFLLFVDDRAIPFNGDYKETLKEIYRRALKSLEH